MEKEISEIIEKQLPKQVGEVLQKRLSELENKEKELEVLKKKVANLEISEKEKIEELNRHIDLDKKLSQISQKEVELNQKELKLNNTILEHKLEEANKRAELITSFIHGLVRNVEVRKEIFDSKSSSYTDSNGVCHYPNTTSSYSEKQVKE